ncbi:uncharacterized protein LOC116851079 [Odontomachus brunneus]|uniref:uncharacterized protein LOC116851079 n=1 Tax=Odontomachus brunneus TaxID=486640 RepID=UPI0013F29A33|nr:uncharacterized protein LOC116851079 [Odontomachus brunneus]
MMYTLKGKYVALTMLLLFTLSYGQLFSQQMQQQQQRYNPAVPPLPWHLVPPWEYIVREVILKSVTPSPADADVPHRRPLDASFYGGPVAVYSNDDVNVVLSRGNVYHLPNGHWMLCQDGCVDCEPCVAQRNPPFKWILRRVKQLPASDPPRHDLQLTIMPQADGYFHASNLWPNSYVYVTSPGERVVLSVIRTHQDNDPDSSASLENSFSRQHHRSKNLSRLTERDFAAKSQILWQNDRVKVQENTSTEKTAQEESSENGFLSTRRPRHPRPRPAEKSATSTRTDHDFTDIIANDDVINQLAPKLILGIDQRDRKHLVHVVPVDPSSTATHSVVSSVSHRPTSTQFTTGQAAHSNKAIPERDGQTYQRIFRRVLDSLNTHRRSIENFLESPADNGHGISPPGDNTEVAGFLRNNRNVDRTSVDLEATKRLNGASSSSYYAAGDNRMGIHQERRRGYEDFKHASNGYYSEYRDTNLGKVASQALIDSDRGRERRRIRIKPYSVDSTRQNTPRINLSISSQSSNDTSAVAIPKAGSGNGLVTNFAKQIDLNDTSLSRASVGSSKDSIESSSITTNRKNEQLFTSESLESGNANRDFEVLRHPFRIIVTTESLVIRGEHETPNRTDTLQITT